jgi:hypothetical protein
MALYISCEFFGSKPIYVVPVRLRVGETLCLATLTPHVYLRIYMVVVDDTHAYN